MNPDMYLAHGFAQDDFIDGLAMLGSLKESIKHGVCGHLALKWVQGKMRELAERERKQSSARMRDMTNSIFKAMTEQDRSGALTAFAGSKVARESYALRPLIVLEGNRCTVHAIAASVTSKKRTCYLYVFDCRDRQGAVRGGHAVAMYLSSGKILGYGKHVYVFDPNEGEYKVPSASFRPWLNAFLSKYNAVMPAFANTLWKYL